MRRQNDICSSTQGTFLKFFFEVFFYVCFSIFTSMCRTVLIFLLMDSSEFRQCFIYAKHNSSMIFAGPECFEVKVIAKKGVKVRIFDILKIRLNLYFKAFFLRFLKCFHFHVSRVPDCFTHRQPWVQPTFQICKNNAPIIFS